MRPRYLDNPGPIAFAHRGGAGEWPENSLEAFEGAVKLGYRYLETDVHLTRDGVVVAFHDDRLDRATDGEGRIAALSWDQVRRARVGGVGTICTLEQLLEHFPSARFNLDAKTWRVVEPLAELIVSKGAAERVCVGAFSDRRVRRLRQLIGPEVCAVIGPAGVARLRAASLGLSRGLNGLGPYGGHCAQVPAKVGSLTIVDERFVRTAHEAGLAVHVWTIDDPREMHTLLDLGVDGIMTDRPNRLREVLIQRGQWSPALVRPGPVAAQ